MESILILLWNGDMVESIGEVLGTKLPDTYRGQLLNCGPQWDGGKDRVIDLERNIVG